MAARIGVGGTLLVGLLALAGCQQPPDGAQAIPPDPRGEPNVGSFSMQLTVGVAYRFNEVSYDVSGNGFHKTGSINVAASNTVSTIIGGVPFGAGYLLKVTTQDVDHKLTPCTGSASFDIASAAIVPVAVNLSCREVPKVAAAVPVPRWASFVLAALLLAVGALAVRQRALTPTTSRRNI